MIDLKKYLTGNNEIRLEYMKKWQKEIKYLYRYRHINEKREYEIEALEKRDIFCSSFDKLNDGEEGIIIRELLRKFPSSMKKQVKKQLEELRKKFGVACFSKVEPYNTYAEYMWENYAGNGEGICIQYNISDMIDKNFYIIPVKYVKKLNIRDFLEENTFVSELTYVMKHCCGSDKDKKNRIWEIEQEWRHMIEIDNEYGKYSEIYLQPAKIFIGKRLKEIYKNKIYKMLSDIEIVEL